MTAPRLRCFVPFCRCTRGSRKADPLPDDVTGMEWICAKHWRRVPMLVKAHRRAADRRVAKIARAWWADHAQGYRRAPHAQWDRLHRRADQAAREAWKACTASAVEQAAGL